jgi:Actin like proteins N terminal domain
MNHQILSNYASAKAIAQRLGYSVDDAGALGAAIAREWKRAGRECKTVAEVMGISADTLVYPTTDEFVLNAIKKFFGGEIVEKITIGQDTGNGAVKTFASVGGKVTKIRYPSFFLEVERDRSLFAGVRVDYVSGNSRWDGKSWVCGDYAEGVRREQVFENRADGKVKLALPFLLYSLSQLPVREHYEIKLACSVHDAKAFGDELRSEIQGHHVAMFAKKEVSINIEVLGVFDEGEIFSPTGKQRTTIIDIGNGTTILSRYDEKGTLLERESPYQFGVQHLYQTIYNHVEVRKLGLDRKIDLIRRGVEESKDGKVFYGYNDGQIDITTPYRESLKAWCEEYLKKPIAKVETNKAEGDRIVLVGGGACLPLLDANFKKKGYLFNENAPFLNAKKLHEYADKA